MKLIRIIIWIGGTLAILWGLAFSYYNIFVDREGQPFCHKQIHLGFINWMLENGMDINTQANAFPNINGKSADSIAALVRDGMDGYMDWAIDYRYVPGLREDDPGDLVLMYFNRPTRWTWHVGLPPSIFKRKAWIVIPVDFAWGSRSPLGPGEMSERVPVEKFRSRLRRTIDFLRTNERPHWETVVAEHEAFLDSIEHLD